MHNKFFFDVTSALDEKAIALWIGYRANELVLCAACKEDIRCKRWVVVMWEIINGIHQKNSLCSTTIKPQVKPRDALNKLLPLFGTKKDASDVMILEHIANDDDDFWNNVNKYELHNIISRSRISEDIKNGIIKGK